MGVVTTCMILDENDDINMEARVIDNKITDMEFDNDIIEQLIILNVGNRDEIMNAMKNVINPNDINEIINYLTNEQNEEDIIYTNIPSEELIDNNKSKFPLKYIVSSYCGSYCTVNEQLSSSLICILPIGTVVIVEKIINIHCQISYPNDGWILLNTISKYNNQILSLSNAYYYLSFNELTKLNINDKIDHLKYHCFYSATILEKNNTNLKIRYDELGE
eukprot:187112_1